MACHWWLICGRAGKLLPPMQCECKAYGILIDMCDIRGGHSIAICNIYWQRMEVSTCQPWTYNCSKGTTGNITGALRPTLEQHKLLHRIYAYVVDKGGNLKTTTTTLSNGLEYSCTLGCTSLGITTPYKWHCYAHAINGSCNRAVVDARGKKVGINTVGKTWLDKLRAVGT